MKTLSHTSRSKQIALRLMLKADLAAYIRKLNTCLPSASRPR